MSLVKAECNNLSDTKTTLIVLNSLDMLLQQPHPVVQLTMNDVCIPDKIIDTRANIDHLFVTISELLGLLFVYYVIFFL